MLSESRKGEQSETGRCVYCSHIAFAADVRDGGSTFFNLPMWLDVTMAATETM